MVHQMTSTDAGMFFVESNDSPNHITPISIYDQSTAPGGIVRFRDIVRRLEEALDAAPTFRRKLMPVPFNLDEPYWVDDPAFNIDFHVRHMALPKPGDWRQFCIQIARLISRPLDFSHSPWEMYVIEGLDHVEGLPAGCFAVVFKIHHAMVDGMGTLALLNNLWEFDAKPRAFKDREPWTPEPPPSQATIGFRAWMNAVTRPVQFAARLGSALPKPSLASREEAAEKAGNRSLFAPPTPLNGKVTAGRVFDILTVPLDEMKAMRALADGATINDAVIAVVSGALRRYLLAKDALPETSLISSVPISMRSEKTRDNPAGNEIVLRMLPISTEIADPVERLKAVARTTGDMKARGAQSGASLLDLATELPGAVTGFVARAMTAMGDRSMMLIANTTVTNVPGPQIPLYLLGARAVRMGGGAPCPGNIGVMHGITSYNGDLGINVTGVADLLPDIDFYMQCLTDSYEEYRKLAGKKAS